MHLGLVHHQFQLKSDKVEKPFATLSNKGGKSSELALMLSPTFSSN